MHWRVVKVRLLWMEAEVAALEGLKARLDTRTHVHACARAHTHTHARTRVAPGHCVSYFVPIIVHISRLNCKRMSGSVCKPVRACPETRVCLLTGSFLVLGGILKPKPVLEPGLGTGPVLVVVLGP